MNRTRHMNHMSIPLNRLAAAWLALALFINSALLAVETRSAEPSARKPVGASISIENDSPRSSAEKEAAEWRKRSPREPRDIPDYQWDRYIREVPEWYQDAKFGVYTHWGPYNQGMEQSGYTGNYNSWFAKFMYVNGHPYNIYHINTLGPLDKVGYSAYFKTFTIPKFDPDKWADLIAASGARFAGPVAMHHEGFAMWDSKVVPWNSMTSAAGRDIAGQLIDAYRRRGLKIVSSFHHAFNITGQYYGGRPDRPKDHPVDFNSELSDPKFARLYGKFEKQEEAEQYWLDVLTEYIVKYKPDQLWFDGGLHRLSDEILFEMVSFYYDFCERAGIKGIISMKHDQLPRRVSIFDFERGGAPEIYPRTWQTDDSPGPWMFIEAMEFKGADWVIPLLVDIVSKNGVLLLNIAPLADGSIHPQQKQMLQETGVWLKVNGEAVYGSRPWKTHYQGDEPHFYAKGRSFAKTFAEYGPDDFRFTRSKDGGTLYMFAMSEPDGDIVVESLKASELGVESGVTLLGQNKVLPLSRNGEGNVVIPAGRLIDGNPNTLKGPRVFKIMGLRYVVKK